VFCDVSLLTCEKSPNSHSVCARAEPFRTTLLIVVVFNRLTSFMGPYTSGYISPAMSISLMW
jgi:hypothetical protein